MKDRDLGGREARPELSAAPGRARPLSIAFLIIVALAPVLTPAAAHETEIDTMAAKMAHSLESAKQSKVVVLDFVAPGRELTFLGTKFADDFSTALGISDPKLHTINRPRVRSFMQKQGFTFEVLTDSVFALDLGRGLKADAVVLGNISRDEGELKISVSAIRIKGHERLDSEATTIAITDQTARLMEPYFRSSTGLVPESGKDGYSFPRCVFCPQAQVTDAAKLLRMVQGTVILVAVVTGGGRAQNIGIVKGLGYGLTESAVKAVQSWRFAPARGPDGKPTAVRQSIEVTFHFY